MPARRRKQRVLARDQPAELEVAATNGSVVTDSRGRKYIDFVMGWCVGNFGWRPASIAKAIERFKGASAAPFSVADSHTHLDMPQESVSS